MRSELERIGYLGDVPASYRSTPMAAHFELHIEQGPILEAQQQKIGVVQGVQAYKWFTIDVEGRGEQMISEARSPPDVIANLLDSLPHRNHPLLRPRRCPAPRIPADHPLQPRRGQALRPRLNGDPHPLPRQRQYRTRPRPLQP